MDLIIKNYYEYSKKTRHPVKAVCLMHDKTTGVTSRGVARANRDWGDHFFKRHGRQLAKGRALEVLQNCSGDLYNKKGFCEGEIVPKLSEMERKLLFPLDWDTPHVTLKKWQASKPIDSGTTLQVDGKGYTYHEYEGKTTQDE